MYSFLLKKKIIPVRILAVKCFHKDPQIMHARNIPTYIIMNYLPHLLFFFIRICSYFAYKTLKKFGFNLNNVENDRERTLEKLKDTRVEMI